MNVKSILHKSFKYRDSASTDIRATFRRIRREQKLQEKQIPQVVPLKKTEK